MKKLMLVAGARPQFVKLAPVVKAVKKSGNFLISIVHTGQHYDHALSGIFFSELGIPAPDHNLEVGSATQAVQIADILVKLSEVIGKEQPDMLIVFGDTNSTAAAALCGAIHKLPVAHIEAGLREFNRNIPEEINKLVTDAVSTIYFCPTATGVRNLTNSGVTEHVYLTGDVGMDLLFEQKEKFGQPTALFTRLKLKPQEYYFATCHRAANTDHPDNLRNILRAFTTAGLPVVFPVHPRTARVMESCNLYEMVRNTNVILLEPVGFVETQCFIKNARMVLTDSGGVIKEAYFHRVPSVILDCQTEWLEILEEGWSVVAGPSFENIQKYLSNFDIPDTHGMRLGDGTASEKIAAHIHEYFQSGK